MSEWVWCYNRPGVIAASLTNRNGVLVAVWVVRACLLGLLLVAVVLVVFPPKQSLRQGLGSRQFILEVISGSWHEGTGGVRCERRKSQYKGALLRWLLCATGDQFCWRDPKSMKNASQNCLREGWEAGDFIPSYLPLLVDSSSKVVTVVYWRVANHHNLAA